MQQSSHFVLLNDLIRAGYTVAPMLAGEDEQPGWVQACGTRVAWYSDFPAQALGAMPPDAQASPGVVPNGDVVAIRTFGGAESHLPLTPFRFQHGDSVVSMYRAGDDLSAAFGFDLPPRSFGWQDDNAAMFVVERAQAVAVPIMLVPLAAGLPKLNAVRLFEARRRMGSPDITYVPFDPIAEVEVAEAGRKWALAVGETPPPFPDFIEDPFAERRGEIDKEFRLADLAARAAARERYGDALAKVLADPSFGLDTSLPWPHRPRPVGLVDADDDGGEAGVAPAVVQTPSAPPAADPYAGLYDVPGLVGEIATYITASAHRPIPLHALGAALVIIGTAAGRKYIGPTYSGTHLYVLGLAPTGAGKNHPGSCLINIMEGAGLKAHTGSSMPKSGAAMNAAIKRHPLSVYRIDEFGDFLAKINGTRAGAHHAEIASEFKTLWGMSYQPYQTPDWAMQASDTIHSPAVSIYGMTTAAKFYENLSSNDVKGGLLNRFLPLEAMERGRVVEPTANPMIVPESILSGVRAIYGEGDFVAMSRDDIKRPESLISVPWGVGAKALYDEAMIAAEQISDKDEERGDYYSRSAEMALRIATICAIGRDHINPVVSPDDMRWAIRLVAVATKRLFERADLYVADNAYQANSNIVRRIVVESRGWVTRSAITKKVKRRFPPKVTEEVLSALVDAGEIERKEGERGSNGKVPILYRAI